MISEPGRRRAKGRAQAATRLLFALRAAPRSHDISAGQVRDKPNLDCFAARASVRSKARKLLSPRDDVTDIRSEVPVTKIRRQYGY